MGFERELRFVIYYDDDCKQAVESLLERVEVEGYGLLCPPTESWGPDGTMEIVIQSVGPEIEEAQ